MPAIPRSRLACGALICEIFKTRVERSYGVTRAPATDTSDAAEAQRNGFAGAEISICGIVEKGLFNSLGEITRLLIAPLRERLALGYTLAIYSDGRARARCITTRKQLRDWNPAPASRYGGAIIVDPFSGQ